MSDPTLHLARQLIACHSVTPEDGGCMEIIAELEGEGRGFYTGALGYLGVDGRMDLNILIRSLTLAEGRIEFRAGAGIVADSDPQHELDETRAKARGLVRALMPEAP